ncbi:ZINC FINGER FYVE DOMAIN CONTAINING PROTEIN [Salix purpurea]|uniref:ZINC FINGER FYVE DOMAIN CONTAINING PROTEIN n=1 Tax=Salix purpurea TaxID=77065 RepID=A0A9Q0SRI1_SALPP|nr:ZINC FINGER FYVE DOMAIN CONTAINING PROTEIN [Salix purpurea]
MAIGGEFDRQDGGSSEAYGYCRVQMPQCMKFSGERTFLVVNVAPIGYYLAFLFELPHKSSDIHAFGCLISYNKAVMDCNNMLKTAPSQTRMAFPKASLVFVAHFDLKASVETPEWLMEAVKQHWLVVTHARVRTQFLTMKRGIMAEKGRKLYYVHKVASADLLKTSSRLPDEQGIKMSCAPMCSQS